MDDFIRVNNWLPADQMVVETPTPEGGVWLGDPKTPEEIEAIHAERWRAEMELLIPTGLLLWCCGLPLAGCFLSALVAN